MRRRTASASRQARPGVHRDSENNAAAFVPPYPPSWFDRLTDWVDRLPGPFWLAYLCLWAGLFAVETVVHWLGAGPIGAWRPLHAVLSAFAPVAFGLMHGLDRLAERSFESFQTVLSAQAPDPRRLRYQLTTLPRRPALIVTVVAVLMGVAIFLGTPSGGRWPEGVLGNFVSMQVSLAPAAIVVTLFILILTLPTVGLLIFHTLRQLHWVSRIYTRWTTVDLLKSGPLYSLSRISAGTTMSLILVAYAILAADRAFLNDARNTIAAGVFAVLGALAFVLPLWGVHRTLVGEKERLLDESSDRMKASLAELHRRIDQGRLREMDALHKAIASLEIERNLLSRIPTWPWQPETLRTVIVALLLPLILWAAQAVLGRVLSS